MIRATKGKSMDGWRRPNHMRSQIGGPKAMLPVNFRRLAGGFHSVAKQASFETNFFSIFFELWSILAGPKGSKNRLLRGFVSMFFSNVFWHRFFIVFLKVEPLILLIFLHTRGVL